MGMGWATGSIYSGDPEVDRSKLALHLVFHIISSHYTTNYTLHLSHLLISLTLSEIPHSRVLSYLLTLYLHSSSLNCCFPQNQFGMLREVQRIMMQGSLHKQNVHPSGRNTQSSQTLRATSPVLLSTSSCSQTPLKLSKVLSDCARAFSGAPERTWSYGGAFRMLRDMIYWIVKCWSSGDLCADLRETSRAALRETSGAAKTPAQHYRRPGAVFPLQWFLLNHKAFRLVIFIFVTVTRFTTS